MDGNMQYPYDIDALQNGEHKADERISVEQLQRLVYLLDSSDVSEIEVKRVDEGIRLALRKAKAHIGDGSSDYQVVVPPVESAAATAPLETKQTVTALFVGIFHSWAKPKGGAVVAAGDRVKVGQLLGTIQSLNVINEVESPVGGCVVEIIVQDGQAVEYGQPLMTIDNSEEA